jgi:hypothetical protein
MKRSILFLVFFIFTFSLFSQIPNYEFIVEPTELMFTYWDYMPGSYNSIPIRIQPEISFPNGCPAGGIYIVFQALEPTIANRKVYYSYLDSEGNLISTDLISTNDIWQGYPGMDIDPISCDPIASWHAVVEPDNSYDCFLSADVFHIAGFSGNWTDEFIVIDNPEVGLPLTGFNDDEFIWPAVRISGSSPLGGDYRRVYVSGNNYTSGHGASGNPSENVILGYADFLSSDLIDLSALDWSYQTVEQMDAWNAENPYRRPFKGCAVRDNMVVYAGYVIDDDNLVNDVFVLVNENYGEGPFEYYSQELMNSNITNFSKNMNVIFRDGNSKISFVGVRYSDTNPELFHPRLLSFDLDTHEFSFLDLYGASLPFIHYEDYSFYNNFKIVETSNWLVAVWQDCLKAKLGFQGVPGYEEWWDVPEIAICISADNGETWSEVIFLNSIETPELEEQIPCYIYPGDIIEVLSNVPGNYRGKVHLFYLDDFIYGCDIYCTTNFGGNLMYTALDIEFPDAWMPGSSTENEEVPQPQITMYNHPNPFNPTTTINYSLKQNSKVSLTIYNIKGQKVKTLVSDKLSAGQHSVVWVGEDDSGNSVSSGIYFYKLKTGDFMETKKCLLLK